MKSLATLIACVALSGCAFYARGADDYRQAVRNVLEEKRPEVERCYKAAYEADPEAKGTVVVQFDVEPKTGKIVRPEVVNGASNAPEALSRCVLSSLDGLVLTPPDQRKGEARFTWTFGG